MKTLEQHLSEFSTVDLRIIAQKQGLLINTSLQPDELRAQLLTAILHPDHLAEVWEDLPEPQRLALRQLQVENNRIPAARFEREFGAIRRLGPGLMEQERPWERPLNVAEALWYQALITREFVTSADGIIECFAIPADMLPLLPQPTMASPAFHLPAPIPVPDSALAEGERFLDDFGTLLIYVLSHRIWVNAADDWPKHHLDQLTAQLIPPVSGEDVRAERGRLELLFHCADHLGLVHKKGRRQFLNPETVPSWLATRRHQQVDDLIHAWRDSEHWNDLCRTPGLICQPGNWQNDPVATRAILLDLLHSGDTGAWYRLDAFTQAVYEQQPDFQRPDGNYNTWYVIDENGRHLSGFDCWHDVEGKLIRYMLTGPLFWLGVVHLDTSCQAWCIPHRQTSGDGMPEQDPDLAIVVFPDFRISVPTGAPLHQRLRVARFCLWEASWPGYRYRITQRSLRRAAASGISTAQILAFLDQASHQRLPANVHAALTDFQAKGP